MLNSKMRVFIFMRCYFHFGEFMNIQVYRNGHIFRIIIYPPNNKFFSPEPTGRKPGARVTSSARLFTPGTMRRQRSVKSINNRDASLWSMGGPPTDLKNMADCHEWKGQRYKKIYVSRIARVPCGKEVKGKVCGSF